MRVRRVWLDNSWVGRCLVGRCPVCGLFLACASFLFYPFLATSLTRRASFGHRQWEPLGVNHMNPNSLSESYSLSLFLTLSLFHSQSLSLSLFLSLCLVLSLSLSQGLGPFLYPEPVRPTGRTGFGSGPTGAEPPAHHGTSRTPRGEEWFAGPALYGGGGGRGEPGQWCTAKVERGEPLWPRRAQGVRGVRASLIGRGPGSSPRYAAPFLPSLRTCPPPSLFSDSVYGCLFLCG